MYLSSPGRGPRLGFTAEMWWVTHPLGTGGSKFHYLLWKKCVELDEPILILEHDAIFKQNIPDIEFDMCVNFGRPSYIRPNKIVYDEPKDGLDIVFNWYKEAYEN